jgi:predicted ATP-binding protein involved in virulence
LIEVAWQIFLRSRNAESFTVVLDEPENHLHPSLQRDILPNMLRAFPGVQFIVATHSPFVVTSAPESKVYVLDYNSDGRIQSRELDYVNKAASADETLRRVLGLESLMPRWAEDRFDEVVSRYLRNRISSESLEGLRNELANQGLAGEFPRAMIDIAENASRSEDV